MTVYRHSRAELGRGIFIALLLGLALGWLAKPIPLPQPIPPMPAVQAPVGPIARTAPPKPSIGRPTLEQVRRAWGIEGQLHCVAGPTPGENR
jgi:hypothetical protein